MARADQLVRPGSWIDQHRPELVLRTGAMPTSKPILQLLERTRPEMLVLDGDGGWRESALLPATFVHADPATTATALAKRLGGGPAEVDLAWGSDWRAADDAASEAMEAWLAALDEPFEGAPFPALAAALPGRRRAVGRQLDAGAGPRQLAAIDRPGDHRALEPGRQRDRRRGLDGARVRGRVADGPVALVVGDLSFLHDLNALVAARLHGLSATIVLVNNDGGGIFSFLSQATADLPEAGLPEHYEELFGTPHGIDVGPIVTALGGEHRRVDVATLGPEIAASVGRRGVRVLELRTNRARNVELHRDVAAVVAAALGKTLVRA